MISEDREWRRLGAMRENPTKRWRGETKHGRESGCRENKRRRRNNTGTTVDDAIISQTRKTANGKNAEDVEGSYLVQKFS